MSPISSSRLTLLSYFSLSRYLPSALVAAAVVTTSAYAAATKPIAAANQTVELGKPLPAWSKGTVEIHHINTGRGDSIFYVLPDGTTMLVDTGDGSAKPLPPPFSMVTKPNDSRQGGEWIARYIHKVLRNFPQKQIDYAVLSHFHGDHIGVVTAHTPLAAHGGYSLTGITEIPEFIPVKKIIDRNWPSYDYPKPLKLDNYRAFLDWQIKHRDLAVEQFVPGRNDQLALRYDAAAYPTFEIRNLIANGRVWTGEGTAASDLADRSKGQILDENQVSIAFRLTYGKFDYFTGGDLDSRTFVVTGKLAPWQNVELAAGRAAGVVDAMKANHHGSWDSNTAEFLGVVQPRVIVITPRAEGHPAVNTFQRMTSKAVWPGPRDIFITHVTPSTAQTTYKIDQAKVQNGHIVIRVDAGGDTYHVYSLDDSDEDQRVTGVFGPYQSH